MVGLDGGPFGMAIGVEVPGVGEIGRSAGMVEEMATAPASTADVVWTEWTLDTTSSSESSELKPSGGTLSIIGKEMGWDDDEWTTMSSERCFFFGCGSSGLLERCFDRTGTAVVVRVVTRGV